MLQYEGSNMKISRQNTLGKPWGLYVLPCTLCVLLTHIEVLVFLFIQGCFESFHKTYPSIAILTFILLSSIVVCISAIMCKLLDIREKNTNSAKSNIAANNSTMQIDENTRTSLKGNSGNTLTKTELESDSPIESSNFEKRNQQYLPQPLQNSQRDVNINNIPTPPTTEYNTICSDSYNVGVNIESMIINNITHNNYQIEAQTLNPQREPHLINWLKWLLSAIALVLGSAPFYFVMKGDVNVITNYFN